jgi:hypothetical protein
MVIRNLAPLFPGKRQKPLFFIGELGADGEQFPPHDGRVGPVSQRQDPVRRLPQPKGGDTPQLSLFNLGHLMQFHFT